MLNIPPDTSNRFPPSGALLIVSPHFDDAALSCAALLDRGEPADVLTIFSGAPEPPQQGWWDERCGFASSAESVPARRREDENALAPRRASNPPARRARAPALRGPATGWGRRSDRRSRARLAGRGGRRNGGRASRSRLGAALAASESGAEASRAARPGAAPRSRLHARSALAGGPRRRLAGPLRGASLRLGRLRRAARRAASEHGYRAHLEVALVDRERKAARLAAYASQIPHISPPEGSLDSPTVLPATERYWRLRRR